MKLVYGIILLLLLGIIITGRLIIPENASVKAQTLPVFLQYSSTNEEVQYREFPFPVSDQLYSLEIDVTADLRGQRSLMRAVLIGTDGHEYLITEAYPLISKKGIVTLSAVCEETCFLDSVTPAKVRIEVVNAEASITALLINNNIPETGTDFQKESENSRLTIMQQKINSINDKYSQKEIQWTAGETPDGKLTYAEKKLRWDKEATQGHPLRNLQGYEFYQKGIFQTDKEKIIEETMSSPQFQE